MMLSPIWYRAVESTDRNLKRVSEHGIGKTKVPESCEVDMGILICGLNGAGKSTLGRMLADRMEYEFIDNEDLFFPKTDPSYTFSGPRGEEEVIRLLEERISENNRFIFAAVMGNYGGKLIAS